MKNHSEFARVQAAYSGDTSTRRAIDQLLLQLADGPDGATPGPEEVFKSHPGADRVRASGASEQMLARELCGIT